MPNLSLVEILVVAFFTSVIVPASRVYFLGLAVELLELTRKRLRRRSRKRS